MSYAPEKLIPDLCEKLLLAEQIDALHLSVAALTDTLESNETDLFLQQAGKSAAQKKLYLQKLIGVVRSAELKALLSTPLEAGDTDFFLQANLSAFLEDMENAVESIEIVRLTVAITFKEKDIRDLSAILSGRLGKPVALDLSVDPSLIGGVIIRHGSYISDYSLKSRLAKFREDWKAAALA